MAVYVGIDWAEKHHDVYVTNDRAERLAAFRIAQSVAGIEVLATRLGELCPTAVEVRIAIERPDGLLVAALLSRGYSVYPINPKAVDRYRDRHRASGAKDDARDALALAHLLRTDGDRFRPLAPEGEVAAELRLTARSYRDLVGEGTRLVNQLRACLADYYPAALGLFSDLDLPIALAFLVAFPTPEAARDAGCEGLTAWLQGKGYPRARIAGIVAKATASGLEAGVGVVRARSRQLLALAAALQTVVAAKRDHERALEELLGRHPDGDRFRDLPGAGIVIAAALLGELGEDRAAVPTAAAMQALGGTAPVTIQSGKARRVARRRACNRHLQVALLQFARSTVLRAGSGETRVAWAKEAFAARRRAGDSPQRAYRVLARRWAAILWAMWTRREAYDHARYERARQLRALPKAG